MIEQLDPKRYEASDRLLAKPDQSNLARRGFVRRSAASDVFASGVTKLSSRVVPNQRAARNCEHRIGALVAKNLTFSPSSRADFGFGKSVAP
jgi:hypothetical protein